MPCIELKFPTLPKLTNGAQLCSGKICYDPDEFGAILLYIELSIDWMNQAYEKCGPTRSEDESS